MKSLKSGRAEVLKRNFKVAFIISAALFTAAVLDVIYAIRPTSCKAKDGTTMNVFVCAYHQGFDP